MSAYDRMAADFDRHRALPDGVAEAVREAVLRCGVADRPSILDVGAGTGRVGRCFVAAGDDYTGVDLSFGMLLAFAAGLSRDQAAAMPSEPTPDNIVTHSEAGGVRLVRADAERLPFARAAFDVALLIRVLSGAAWSRALLAEAMRVVRPGGVLMLGRVLAPEDGVDAQMKARLAVILSDMGVQPHSDAPRADALAWLERVMPDPVMLTVAAWAAARRPAAFLERHAAGARFSVVEAPIRDAAMARLAAWAAAHFGSLERVTHETYRFELIIHRVKQRGSST